MKEACSECSTIETANSLKDNYIPYQLPDGNVIQVMLNFQKYYLLVLRT